jgi:hypothetical protein
VVELQPVYVDVEWLVFRKLNEVGDWTCLLKDCIGTREAVVELGASAVCAKHD